MKRVGIVQARGGSRRLPRKVLQDICGRPMLSHVIRRVAACDLIDTVWVATTGDAADDAIAQVAVDEGANVFRGSEDDVLSRFLGAAREAAADVVIRVTADCPLLDPGVTRRVLAELLDHPCECDYVSNVGRTSGWEERHGAMVTTPLERTFPRGLDVEVMFMDTLMRMDRYAVDLVAREHVTVVARSTHASLFASRLVQDRNDNSDLRWTVDTKDDLTYIRRLFAELDLGRRIAPYQEVLQYVRTSGMSLAHPEGETVSG